MVLNLAELESDCRWKWFFRPRQMTGMSVADYYNRFRVWMAEMINLSFPAKDEDYIDGFIENLSWDIQFRVVSKCRLWISSLSDAFHNAKIEESLIRIEGNLKELRATRVFDEMPSPTPLECEKVITAESVAALKPEGGAYKLECASSIFPSLEAEIQMTDGAGQPSPLKNEYPEVAHNLFDEMPSPPAIELNEENVSHDEMLMRVPVKNGEDVLGVHGSARESYQSEIDKSGVDEVEKFFSSKIGRLEIGHHMFDEMPKLTSAMQNRRIDVHGVVALPIGALSYVNKAIEVSSFHVSSKSKFEEIGTKNYELGVDFWGDGILMFIFDPGGSFSPKMSCGQLTFLMFSDFNHGIFMFSFYSLKIVDLLWQKGTVFNPIPFLSETLLVWLLDEQPPDSKKVEFISAALDALFSFSLKYFFQPTDVKSLQDIDLHLLSWNQDKRLWAFVSGPHQVTVHDYDDAEGKDPCILINESQKNVKWLDFLPSHYDEWLDFLPSHYDEQISSLSWSPDGRFLASASFQNSSFTVWDVSQGKGTPIRRGLGGISLLKWSPSGDYFFASKFDGTFYLWETKFDVILLAFNPGGAHKLLDGFMVSQSCPRLCSGLRHLNIVVQVFIWDPGKSVISFYILEDKDVFKRVGKDIVLMDTILEITVDSKALNKSSVCLWKQNVVEMNMKFHELFIIDLDHLHTSVKECSTWEQFCKGSRPVLVNGLIFSSLFLVIKEAELQDCNQTALAGSGPLLQMVPIGVIRVNFQTFVWDPGLDCVSFRFSTLRTRCSFRGEICHDIAFIISFICIFVFPYLRIWLVMMSSTRV